jgi:hypothetical protein
MKAVTCELNSRSQINDGLKGGSDTSWTTAESFGQKQQETCFVRVLFAAKALAS